MAIDKTQGNDVEEFALAISLLLRRIRSAAPAELREFSWTEKAVLSRLDKDGPATSADLARAEGVTPQSMGTVITALEEMGFVERKAHPTDGRQLLIKLSAKGAALRKSTTEAKYTWFSSALATLDKRDQAVLFKAGRLIKQMVEQS